MCAPIGGRRAWAVLASRAALLVGAALAAGCEAPRNEAVDQTSGPAAALDARALEPVLDAALPRPADAPPDEPLDATVPVPPDAPVPAPPPARSDAGSDTPAIGGELPCLESPGHSPYVTTSLAFSPDGRHLASGSNEGTVRLWAAADLSPVMTLDHGTSATMVVRFSPDGARIFSASSPTSLPSSGGVVKIWSADGRLLRTLEGGARSLRFSPDGRLLALTRPGGEVTIHDASSTALRHTLLHDEINFAEDAVFSADGQRIFTIGRDPQLKAWRASDGGLAGTVTIDLERPFASIEAIEPVPGSDLVAISFARGPRTDRRNRNIIEFRRGFDLSLDRSVTDFFLRRVSADGALMAAGAGYPGFSLSIHRTSDGGFLTGLTRQQISAPSFSPDGRRLCAGPSTTPGIRCWCLQPQG
jgi:WD40 repeat protein